MPRYYLHLFEDGEWLHDQEGVERPDLEAARHEAMRAVRDIIASDVQTGYLNLDGMLAVDDESGSEVFRMPFSEALSPVGL